MPSIHGVSPFNIPANVTRTFAMRIPPEVQRIVVDTPAAINKHQFIEFTRGADRVLIPVLPSDIDIQAVTRCIADLLLHAKIQRSENRIAVVANRVKRNTVMFRSLMRFLDSLKIPVVAVLPDSQHYIRAASTGIGLHEMNGARFRVDQAHWTSLIEWIEHGTRPGGRHRLGGCHATQRRDQRSGKRSRRRSRRVDRRAGGRARRRARRRRAEPSAGQSSIASLRGFRFHQARFLTRASFVARAFDGHSSHRFHAGTRRTVRDAQLALLGADVIKIEQPGPAIRRAD